MKKLFAVFGFCFLTYASMSQPNVHPEQWQYDSDKSDEFNGTTLDTSKWWATDICAFTDGIRHGFNGEGAFFRPENILFGNGNMILKIEPNPDSLNLAVPCTHFIHHPFYSGGIMSIQKTGGTGFGSIGNFSFGYYEMRAKLPGYYDSTNNSTGFGFYPTFWFAYQYVNNNCIITHDEVDVLESGPTEYYDARSAYSVWHDEDGHCSQTIIGKDSMRNATPLFEEYHTYAVDLEPDKIIFYFDGVPFLSADTLQTPSVAHSLNMLSYITVYIGMQMGGYGRPAPRPDAPFPEYMYVDYFRYYHAKPFSESALFQNYPNPFRESTKIGFVVESNAVDAVLNLYNWLGEKINSKTLPERGSSEITLVNADLYPGMYYYQLTVDNKVIGTKKMIVVR